MMDMKAAKIPVPAPKKSAAELTEKELARVAGGFNPQPDPPARSGRGGF